MGEGGRECLSYKYEKIEFSLSNLTLTFLKLAFKTFHVLQLNMLVGVLLFQKSDCKKVVLQLSGTQTISNLRKNYKKY